MFSPRIYVSIVVLTWAFLAPATLPASVVNVYPGDPNWWAFQTGSSSVEITGTNPRSGNGSLEFFGGTTGYSNFLRDLSYLDETWGDLNALSLDWYVDSVSGYAGHPNPALELHWTEGYFYVSWAGGTGVTDTWQTTDWKSLLSLDTGIPGTTPPGSMGEIPSTATLVSLHLRSATNNPLDNPGPTWHAFVDNVTLGLTGQSVTFNFEESAVPEPGSVLLFASGLGLAALVRRVSGGLAHPGSRWR